MKKWILILTFVLMLIWYLNTNEVMAACREWDSDCEQRAKELAESDAELAARDAANDAGKAAGTTTSSMNNEVEASATKADMSTSTNGNMSYKTFSNPEFPQSTVSSVYKDGVPTGETITKTMASDGTVSVTVKDANGNVTSAQSQADGTWTGDPAAAKAGAELNNASGDLKTITSEKVPGATCTCQEGADCTKVETRKYVCTSLKGLTGFQQVFAQIIRYVINIVLLLGVLAVAGLGVAWSFAGGDDIKMKSTLKKWAINIIIGLVILFMFGYILRFLAPWVYV